MFTVVTRDDEEHDFLLDADDLTPLSAITKHLGDGSAVLYHGRNPLPSGMTLAESPLRDGSRIGLNHPVYEPPQVFGPFSLRPQRPKPADDFTQLLAKRRSSVGWLLTALLSSAAAVAGFALTATTNERYVLISVFGLVTIVACSRLMIVDGNSYTTVRALLQPTWVPLKLELSQLRLECPDPEEALEIAYGVRPTLWVRQRSHLDHLLLRVGTADQPAAFALRHRRRPDPIRGTAKAAPVTLRLPESGVVGIADARDTDQAIARWLVAQIAVLHSPDDVQVWLLTDADGQGRWDWIRWLPHCRAPGRSAIALIGNDDQTRLRRVTELLQIIAERRAARRKGTLDETPPPPDIVVVLDGELSFREPGALKVLTDGPEVGVYVICVAGAIRSLPTACRTVVAMESDGLLVRRDGDPPISRIHRDLLAQGQATLLARSLALVPDVDGQRLPDSVRLLDLLGTKHPTALAIFSGWNSGDGSTRAVIGMATDGPLAVDLVNDGPHGLIAGTTGSGKSELLQTIVASLAVTNRPDLMTFLLVDYKGGAAFGQWVNLPHTVGLLTDLDNHAAKRALQSLSAELTRREYILQAAGSKDIEDYGNRRARNNKLEAMPRLVILVDEFAAMAQYLPDFIPGLVEVARRGRSLGVHLLLATQRPAGVVSPDISANTNLRIALRMADAEDSRDVIGTPEAAGIPTWVPGRGFLQAGFGRPLVAFQAAQVGDYLPMPEMTPAHVALTRVGWADLGWSAKLQWSGPREVVTGLQTLVDAIGEANRRLGLELPRRPLLPPLPTTVLLSELPKSARDAGADGTLPQVPFGINDFPAEQTQRPMAIDFASFQHLLAAGSLRSGRSQLLRTIAGSIAAICSCADVHIYGIDYSPDGLLAAVAELPHCGALVTQNQDDRAARLIRRLRLEVRRRQELLAEAGFGTIGEQRAAASAWQRLPHIVILLNGWEEFSRGLDKKEHTSTMLTILRDGVSVGVHLVVTGDRTLLSGSVAAMVDDKVVYRLDNPSDYALAGLRPDDLPSEMVAGRVVHVGSGIEAQVALLDGEPTWYGQAEALHKLAETARLRDAAVELARRPFQVDEISLAGDRFHVGDAQGQPIGREDVLAWLRDRHATGSSVALLGPRRAGKTWVLTELCRRVMRDGSTHVYQVTVPQLSAPVETPDAFAKLLDRRVRDSAAPAEELLDDALSRSATGDRLVYLLDEVGRLVDYGAAAVSWLRDLGQAGAWLAYTGTEKDWHAVVRWALTAPGSSFGNDVNARILGPIDRRTAVRFLTGTAANLRVELPEKTGWEIVKMTDSWPFYLQAMGDAVVRVAQSGDGQLLTGSDELRQLMEQRLLDEWKHHFEARWVEIGTSGRAALLEVPGATPTSLTPAQRDDLRDVGLLRPGDVWLADQPFFDWVARNATTLRNGEKL
jgi:S-DNA-T family DNA segregation ATPase FtsK/SpoIIIE